MGGRGVEVGLGDPLRPQAGPGLLIEPLPHLHTASFPPPDDSWRYGLWYLQIT